MGRVGSGRSGNLGPNFGANWEVQGFPEVQEGRRGKSRRVGPGKSPIVGATACRIQAREYNVGTDSNANWAGIGENAWPD